VHLVVGQRFSVLWTGKFTKGGREEKIIGRDGSQNRKVRSERHGHKKLFKMFGR